jgi:hypothetical protein
MRGSRVSGKLVVAAIVLLALGVGALALFYLRRENVEPIHVPQSQPGSR